MLNVEKEWDKGSLPHVNPTKELAILIDSSMAHRSIKYVKIRKAPGASKVMTMILIVSGRVGYGLVTQLIRSFRKV